MTESTYFIDENGNKVLSVQSGIDIQNNQLKRWESVLLPEVAHTLREWAESKNAEAKNGYDIVRGNNMENFIQNHLMTKF